MQCRLLDDGDARDPTSLVLWTQLVNLCVGVVCREHCISVVSFRDEYNTQLFYEILHMQVN